MSDARLKLTRVEPIGEHEDVHGHRLFTYPESAQALRLRELRVRLGIPIYGAACILGITAVQYGELERGRWSTDWNLAMRLLGGDAR